MIKRINHIGLAVENLVEAKAFFYKNFAMSLSDQEHFGELLFSYISLDGADIELLQSTKPEGQINKFINRKGQGIHHMAFEVDDIQYELDHLRSKGIMLIDKKPYVNAHHDLVAFIHPKDTYGVLIELIQKKKK